LVEQVLHVIDFDQLKIENQQYLEKIEERNNELLRLKLTTGKTVQVNTARAACVSAHESVHAWDVAVLAGD
jgi:predicted house-cleaning NTP pyrophosphatase (Maf/HAM1 superfamily)